jgi:hypothetical protein
VRSFPAAKASISERVSGHGGESSTGSPCSRTAAMTNSVPLGATVRAMFAIVCACSRSGSACTLMHSTTSANAPVHSAGGSSTSAVT